MHLPISVLSSLVMAMAVPAVRSAEPPSLKLEYQEEAEDSNDEFPKQIQTAFAKLLEADPELAKKFKEFEAPPVRAGLGKYSGQPEVFPVILYRDRYAHFGSDGGQRSFDMKVALFYRFDNGHTRGMATTSGFFALFSIDGKVTYKITADEKFEISGSEVTATFEGFSRTLTMPGTEDGGFDDQ
jgi:hypothetical protein